jgi:transcriptional regulator with GAF, ATPase, and Fis domain
VNFKLVSNINSKGNSQPAEITAREKVERMKNTVLSLLREVEQLSHDQSEEWQRGVNYYDKVRRFEINLIKHALIQTEGHQVRAARILGLKVTTLNSIIKRYNISLDELQENMSVPKEG